jgi:hypothetical protein
MWQLWLGYAATNEINSRDATTRTQRMSGARAGGESEAAGLPDVNTLPTTVGVFTCGSGQSHPAGRIDCQRGGNEHHPIIARCAKPRE